MVGRRLKKLEPPLKKSMMFDQEKENSGRKELTENTAIAVCFCHPHSPWEKGACENANYLTRDMPHPVVDFRDWPSVARQKLRDRSMSGQEEHLTLERLIRYSRNCVRNYREPSYTICRIAYILSTVYGKEKGEIMPVAVIPEPAFIQERDGFFEYTGLPVIEGDFQSEASVLKTQFAKQFAPASQEEARHSPAFSGTDAARKIVCKRDEMLRTEAYALAIGRKSIELRAGCGRGAYHGLQTLRQLFLSGEKIPCACIEDEPRFGWRGFMLDTSRYFYTAPFIKKLIDALSLHHVNVFHWHLTDDQGWRLPVPEYPLLTEIGSKRVERRLSGSPSVGGFYTEDDIREIVSYASARHVEVTPEVDIPGHASAILAAYPNLGCTGGPYRVEDRFGIFDDVLCAGNDAIFDLADAVFNTLARLFPSPYVHIGGDEVRVTRWSRCPKCNKRLADAGLKNMPELQSRITVRLAAMLAEKGKTAIGWDEVLEDSPQYTLPKEVAVMSWRGADGGKAAVKRGHPVIMSPNTEGCYLDYRNCGDAEEPGQLGVSTVYQSYSMNPVAGMSESEAALVMGGQCNLWSELIYAGRIAEYMIFPRIVAFAENMWTPQARRDFANFARKLPVHRQRLDILDIAQYRGRLK
jgi:hexosaminidase